MAHLLGAQNLRALAGSRIVLDQVNLGLDDGVRVGVLGPNGGGKSTLIHLLAGQRPCDGGLVTRADGVQIALLDQSDKLQGATVSEAIHGSSQDFQWASNPEVRQIHAGLLADLDMATPIHTLSGGQRRRVALAACLTKSAQVVFLDEPTNHLDVEAIAWLAQYLRGRFAGAKGALVVVTHDRWFLDQVCSRIWEVIPGIDPGNGRPQIPGRVEAYEGAYAAFVLARAERERQAAVAAEKRSNLLRKELAWLQRGAPARTSKSKFRQDAALALIEDVPPPRDQVELVKLASARLGKKVVDLIDVGVVYGSSDTDSNCPENTVLSQVTWRLSPGERVGIIGTNGAGKTTLLRLLAGTQTPDTGRVLRGKTVEMAYLSQSTAELDQVSGLRVVEAVAQVALSIEVAGKELTAAQLVERLGFTKQRAWTVVSELSGGERRRLQLMRLMMSQPNVLLLDEPTNDLDTDTLAALEDLLDSFAGTLVIVSHDRYLLERATDHQMALLGDGRVRDLPGGVEQYLQLRQHLTGVADKPLLSVGIADILSDAQRPGTKPKGTIAAKPGGADAGKSGCGIAGNSAKSSDDRSVSQSARRRELQKEASRAGRKLDRLQQDQSALTEKLSKLADKEGFGGAADYEQMSQLSKELGHLQEQITLVEEQWLTVSSELEELSS